MENEKKPVKSVTVKYEPKEPQKKTFGRSLKKFFKVFFGTLLVLALIAGGIIGGMHLQKSRDEAKAADEAPVITNYSISQKVVELKQLTTAQLTYHGLVEFEEGKVRFINEKAFLMTYTGKVTAGVDFSKAKITESEKQITIELPDAEIFTTGIDPNTIQFYDTKKALFNKSDKEDTVEAEKEAKADMEASMDKKELLDTAKAQAKTMVLEMFTPVVGEDVKLVVV